MSVASRTTIDNVQVLMSAISGLVASCKSVVMLMFVQH